MCEIYISIYHIYTFEYSVLQHPVLHQASRTASQTFRNATCTTHWKLWKMAQKFVTIPHKLQLTRTFCKISIKHFWTFYYNSLNKSPRKFLLYHALCPSLSLGNLCHNLCSQAQRRQSCLISTAEQVLSRRWGWGASHRFQWSAQQWVFCVL